jgi:clan AA aspartic protease
MITGAIRNREAIIGLDVSGPGPLTQQTEAVIDTGYNGYLTLPPDLVARLQLPFAGHRSGKLADGSITVLNVYLGRVVWHERQKEVLIAEAAGAPLIGMSLLERSHLAMDVIDGADVIIEELPHQP